MNHFGLRTLYFGHLALTLDFVFISVPRNIEYQKIILEEIYEK